MCVCVCACMCVCVFACVHLHMCMCVCVHAHVCVCEGGGRVMLVRHLCVLRVKFWCQEICVFLFGCLLYAPCAQLSPVFMAQLVLCSQLSGNVRLICFLFTVQRRRVYNSHKVGLTCC